MIKRTKGYQTEYSQVMQNHDTKVYGVRIFLIIKLGFRQPITEIISKIRQLKISVNFSFHHTLGNKRPRSSKPRCKPRLFFRRYHRLNHVYFRFRFQELLVIIRCFFFCRFRRTESFQNNLTKQQDATKNTVRVIMDLNFP